MHGCVSLPSPPLGTWYATQAYALTGNQTRNSGSHAHVQFTELHQPGHLVGFLSVDWKVPSTPNPPSFTPPSDRVSAGPGEFQTAEII